MYNEVRLCNFTHRLVPSSKSSAFKWKAAEQKFIGMNMRERFKYLIYHEIVDDSIGH